MARVEVHKEIDTEGEELLIKYMIEFLKEMRLRIKLGEETKEYLIYCLDKEKLRLDEYLNKLHKEEI